MTRKPNIYIFLTMVFLFFFSLFPWVPKNAVAGDYHVGSQNLFCSDCHTIHYSQDGGVSAVWGQAGPYERLLKNLTNEMCLMCHGGLDPSAPHVMGETRYVSSAGEFSSSDPNCRHSLGSTESPPGFSGTWSGNPLTCITCHNPHGNDYYRNLRTNPGQDPNITVTYETGAYGGEVAVQQLLDTPLAEHYEVGNIKHRQSESGNNLGLSAWCAGCHDEFYGHGGDENMGGSSSGDTQALDTDTWIRHPTVGITLAQGVTNQHIDGTADGGLGYWWSSLVLSRPPYISPLGQISTKSSSDNETGCSSCHKAHGSDQLFCLIYDDPETSTLEDGSRMVGTCQTCHLRGGTDDEDNGIYEVSPHGHPDTGLSRDDRWLKGECNQCHLQHAGKDYNLFTDNSNALCYTTGCHDFTPTGGYSGYPAQEEDRAPATSDYPGYFEYFVSGAKAPGLNNRVAWPGMDVFENPNTWDDGPPQKFYSPHRNDPDMPIKDSSGVGRCVNCHSPHGSANPFDMLVDTYLSTKGSSQGDEPLNYELCLKCHDHDGPAGMDSENKNISHYYNKSINPETAGHMIRKSTNSASYWPAHIQAGDRLACSNCHNPHGTRGHADIGLPNARLLSDQRPGYDGIIDTKTMASQCRPFCFSCHVPSDDPNCTRYNGECPEVDGIVMAPIPDIGVGEQKHHRWTGTTHCYNCHGKDYDVTTAASPAFNVHNPKPKPGHGPGPSRLKSAPLPSLAPPTGFTATGGKRLVELSWEKYPDENIRGYHLYRSQTPGGPYSLISSEPDHVSRYMDKDVSPEQNYYYVLTVEDMQGVESLFSEEARATPVSLTPEQLKTLEEVKGLSAKIEGDMICLTWEESLDELVAGYHVYRRLEGGGPQWDRLTRYEPLRWPVYEDSQIVKGKVYLYTVAAVDSIGNEARFPKEVRVPYEALYIFSISLSQGDAPLQGGRQMVATLTGSPGQIAYFTIEGLAGHISMKETDDTGTYIGKYLIPGEIDTAQFKVTGFLEDGQGKTRSKASPVPLKIDNLPPLAPSGFEAAVNSDGRVSLLWTAGQKADDQIDSYRIYRGLNEDFTPDDTSRLASDLPRDRHEYKDFDLRPDTRYYYRITSVDEAENESAPSSRVEAFVPPDTIPPSITEMRVIGEKEVWNHGESISLLMIGEPGCKAAFSLGNRIKDIVMIESFEKGRYEGKYVFQDTDETKGMIITGRLTDPSGNSATRTLSNRVSVVRHSAGAKPEIYAIEEDSFQVGGSVGLVAGDPCKIIVRGTPGCKAFFHLGAYVNEDGTVSLDWNGFSEADNPDISTYRVYKGTWSTFSPDKQNPLATLGLGAREYLVTDTEPDRNDALFITAVSNDGHLRLISTPKRNISLKETDDPGTYEGEYTVLPTDRIIQGYIFASLRDEFGQASSPFRSSHTITMDTESRIEVRPLPPELKADSLSRCRVLALLKNAQGRGVADRQVGVTLFASSEYTGLVGLGKLNQADIGYVVNPLFGMNDPAVIGAYVFTTDGFGQISMEYQTGFAAKTIIFRAEDQITGDVGFGYLTSYLETQAQVEQYLPIAQAKAMMRAKGQEYYLSLSASPQWLTADGVGSSRIRAELIDRNGTTVQGHRITFTVSMGDGYLQPRESYTDAGGKAEVMYRAGKSIGTVEITATDVTATPHLGAKTHIVLKSDAPAVLEVKVKPERIPADGKSTCTLTIKVTDINKNPCRGVASSVKVISGSGKILKTDEITDFSGQARAVYQAGNEQGTAKFTVRVTSKIPTSKESEDIRWAR